MHVQQEKSLPFAFAMLSGQKNMSAMFTPLPLPDLKYVHGWFRCVINNDV